MAAAITCLLIIYPVSAAENSVEFKPVLSETETKAALFDVIQKDNETLYVHRLPFLADRDVEEVEIFRSANVPGRLLVGFTFNENGKVRFRLLVKNFRKKRVVVYGAGKLVAVSPVLPPEVSGERVVIGWPGTEEELRAFALGINKKPPGLLALYIEEQGRYNDIAADMWAEIYGTIDRYVASKSKQVTSDRSMVDAAGE